METATSQLPALKKIGITEEELVLLKNDYEKIIVTPETIKEADQARLVLYRKRTEIQRIDKDNNDALNKLKKMNSKVADDLIAIIAPIEKRLQTEIDSIKAEEERKKEAARLAEVKRVAGIKKRMMYLEDKISVIRACKINEELDKIATEVSAFTDSFEEFNSDGNEIVNTILKSIVNRKLFIAEELKAQALKQKETPLTVVKGGATENHHPHEIGESVDTPEVVKYHEKNVQVNNVKCIDTMPEIRGSDNTAPFMDFWSYSGYKFGFPTDLAEEILNNMKSCITEIIDNMPM